MSIMSGPEFAVAAMSQCDLAVDLLVCPPCTSLCTQLPRADHVHAWTVCWHIHYHAPPSLHTCITSGVPGMMSSSSQRNTANCQSTTRARLTTLPIASDFFFPNKHTCLGQTSSHILCLSSIVTQLAAWSHTRSYTDTSIWRASLLFLQ